MGKRPQERYVWAAVTADEAGAASQSTQPVDMSPSGHVIGIGEVRRQSSTQAEIAYAVHVDLWGRGYGSQLARELVDWAFASFAGLERVQATCDPRNGASEGVLRRAGMQYEGLMRHTMQVRGDWRDSMLFSILRPEWDARDFLAGG